MNVLHLKQSVSLEQVEGLKKGEFKGVAYSGGVIEEHGFLQNLIIDLSTLKTAKKKTPVLRDHINSQVAGSGTVTIEDSVTIEGKLNQKTQYGAEIVELAEDVDWEMSLGVYGGQLREFKNEKINGIEISNGVVLENGTIREVSFVVLGADMNTNAEVFSVKKLEGEIMKLNENAEYIKLACACGGNKETTPEELAQKFAASQEEIDAKQAEIDQLKSDLAKAQSDLEKMKEEEETSANATAIKAAAEEKGVKLSDESVKSAALSKEATEALINTFKSMEKMESKVAPKFTAKVSLTSGDIEIDGGSEDPAAIRLAAEKLVKEGKFPSFLKAIEFLQKNKGE